MEQTPTAVEIPSFITDGLNTEQQDAVATLTGPLLVVAGPGSGKTTVLARRIAALLHTGTPAHRILAVTFTNKAAAEMRDRVGSLVGAPAVRAMWVATFHSACLRILRTHHDLANLPASFSIADTRDSTRLVGQVADDLGHTEGLSSSGRTRFVKDVRADISRAKNAGRGPDDVAVSGRGDDIVTAAIMAEYNTRLRQAGSVDFDDLLLLTRDLLAANPDVADLYASRFLHILVDEYQDTNDVQYQIVARLAAKHRNLCVVGDFDQSIYAFRGADPTVMASFTHTFTGAKVVELGRNYRSTGNIVEVANAVVAPNPSAHRAVLRTTAGPGDHVRLVQCGTGSAEAKFVVASIVARGGSRSDHAILVRTNALTRQVEQELTRSAVPYQVVGALRFYDRAEVKDALSYVRLAVNEADTLAFERCVNTPRRGIGQATVTAVLRRARETGETAVDVMRDLASGPGRSAAAAGRFISAYRDMVAAAEDGPLAAVTAACDGTGLRAQLAKSGEEDGLDRADNLGELVETAAQFEQSGSPVDVTGRPMESLGGRERTLAFLETVALVSSAETAAGTDPQNDGQVSVMTMHACKGKEFRHVYVIGMEEGICPHQRALDEPGPLPLQEERRLFFVAVSRARDTLTISHAAQRSAFGGLAVDAAPSRFLADLPEGVDRSVLSDTGTLWRPPDRVTAVPRPFQGPVRHQRFAAGQRVIHTMFGSGLVRDADARTVTVEFEAGTRVLATDRAPLRVA